jgi:predicted phosphodiesterase
VPTLAEHIEVQPGFTLRLLESDRGHTEVARALEVSEQSVRRWRKKHAAAQDGIADEDIPDQVIVESDREQLHAKLDELLDRAEIGGVTNMRLSTWDGMTKGEDGEPKITRQYGVRLETGRMTPSWPLVTQAQPIVINYPQREPRTWAPQERVAVILPDPQIGYRFYADSGIYDPFHDYAAIDVAVQIVEEVEPHLIICLGDYLDLPCFGKYEQEPAFAHTTQRALDYGHQLLATLRELSPDARIVLLEGNHDRRLEKMVTRNAMEAFGLRRAGDISGWPVLSLPHLLRLGELGVEYVGGYPAGSFWINDRLKCIHGSVVRSAGSTAKAVAEAERGSVIFGHVHRVETQYKTADVHGGGSVRLAHTPGCLCRIDGAVPSLHGSTDLSGRPVRRYEDWQQGVTVVIYREGDAPFSLVPVFIDTLEGHRAVYGEKIFTPGLTAL